MSALYSLFDISDDLIFRKVNESDASVFAKRFGGSSICWGVLWFIVSFVFLGLGIVVSLFQRLCFTLSFRVGPTDDVLLLSTPNRQVWLCSGIRPRSSVRATRTSCPHACSYEMFGCLCLTKGHFVSHFVSWMPTAWRGADQREQTVQIHQVAMYVMKPSHACLLSFCLSVNMCCDLDLPGKHGTNQPRRLRTIQYKTRVFFILNKAISFSGCLFVYLRA